MLKLNRTTEYGLIALRHMTKETKVTSAREIADLYGLPFEITAKTLQRLKDSGLIQSAQGARGGYTLQKSLSEVTLADFVQQMEGPLGVVNCVTTSAVDNPCACEYARKCGMTDVMADLNARMLGFLQGIRLDELMVMPAVVPAVTFQVSFQENAAL